MARCGLVEKTGPCRIITTDGERCFKHREQEEEKMANPLVERLAGMVAEMDSSNATYEEMVQAVLAEVGLESTHLPVAFWAVDVFPDYDADENPDALALEAVDLIRTAFDRPVIEVFTADGEHHRVDTAEITL